MLRSTTSGSGFLPVLFMVTSYGSQATGWSNQKTCQMCRWCITGTHSHCSGTSQPTRFVSDSEVVSCASRAWRLWGDARSLPETGSTAPRIATLLAAAEAPWRLARIAALLLQWPLARRPARASLPSEQGSPLCHQPLLLLRVRLLQQKKTRTAAHTITYNINSTSKSAMLKRQQQLRSHSRNPPRQQQQQQQILRLS